MKQRNKQWRKIQSLNKMKKRLKHFAALADSALNNEGQLINNPKWIDLLKTHTAYQFKNTGTPCSCGICSYLKYERNDLKKIAEKEIKDSYLD